MIGSVAGRLKRDVIVGAETRGEQLKLLGRSLDAADRADLAFLMDRDLAEVAMHVQADEAHVNLLNSLE